jgi:hypothetical protein
LTELNSPGYQGFVSASNGVPAHPYQILFATQSADGKPTPLPEDWVKQAKEVNEAAAQAAVAEANRGQMPAIVGTGPALFADNVPAMLGKLSVTFDRKMTDGSWSWCQRYADKYPKMTGKPSYDAGRTACSVPVQLEPGKVYWLEFNTPPFVNFRSETGQSAPHRALVFATAGADGKPTPLPEDLVKQAREINQADSGPASRPGLAPLTLTAAPWQDGEEMDLSLRTQAGMEIGTLNYHAHALKAAGRDTWCIEADQVVAVMADSIQYTRVDAEADSFAPVTGLTRNERGTFASAYQAGGGGVDLTVTAGGKVGTRHIDVDGVAYDNEQALFLIRRLPLAPGLHTTFNIFSPQSGAAGIACRISVGDREHMKVPAGAFDCLKVTLQVMVGEAPALTHTLWFSADEHRYLVKYDAGTAIMELTHAGVSPAGQAPVFHAGTLDLTLPADWDFYKPPEAARDGRIAQLIAPQDQAWAAVCSVARTAAMPSARDVADTDIKALAGYFKGYTVRPESWSAPTVGGLPAARFVADYQDKDVAMVEYRTYILGPAAAYWLVFRVDKDQFDALRPQFDAVATGFKVK